MPTGRASYRYLASALAAASPAGTAHAFEAARSPAPSTVLFGSLETGPAKTFAAFGLKRALGGGSLDDSGLRLMLKAGGSREQAGRSRPRGRIDKAEAQALIGYEWRISDTFLALYAGSDVESEQPSRGGVAALPRTRFSGRLQADLWATPTASTMIQGAAYLSGIERRAWGRLAAGWSLRELLPFGTGIADAAYVGPEAELFRRRDYTKLRLGLHLTGLRLFGLDWRLSAGVERQSRQGPQAYATLGLHWRR